MALSKKPVNGMKDIMPDEMKIRDYLIDLIKYSINKKEKPVWNGSVVALIVTALVVVYFFVPTVL